ncbi:MAG TPA: L,D-transpeptidase family protein [Pirellulales bacterium]|nr:L,D-transpeptidase family protein [Pirellulales bacterium]
MLKTLCAGVVLAALGYGGYATLTRRADPPEPAGAGDWGNAPQVEMPTVASSEPPAVSLPDAAAADAPAPHYLAPSTTTPPSAVDPATDALASAARAAIDPSAAAPAAESSAATTMPIATLTAEGIEPAAPEAPDVHTEFMTAWNDAQGLLARHELAEALLRLSEWSTDTRLSPADRTQLFDLLDQLAGTVVYSREHLLSPAYVVQPGDSLERIADRFGVTWQLLGKINGIAEGQPIRAGDSLKVLQGPFDALVTLNDCELTLFIHGRYAGRFRVGIGQDQSTPEAELVVQNKVTNPTYYGPNQVIGPEDPNNPLGGRWIDLGNKLGIHGTSDPSSIGKAESRGCIRMGQQDIVEVYDILSIGSRVTIVR